ncbi:protein disulfide isomerase Creld1 isoform X2 [Folsomia candida]|uniref:protein disulfide isomerase Creld1 isoform X2 n=1 Tax=Folsomia candida TaxID=158441 RepID=UPI00160510DB|nr:protein disulfide isomerase Creld1 isoform X2 [Folsomia candida]
MVDMIQMRVVAVLLLLMLGLATAGLPGSGSDPKSSRRLAPCQICRVLVTSFNTGIERTAKGHYTGGDSAWEEENKKTYKNSELRLTEIQEMLCSEVSVGKDHCHEFHINNEDLLEQWWEEVYRFAGEDLDSWLCINQLKVCCKDNHFGAECLPCPGYPDSVCSGHGKCKGNGTRKGSGQCSCETGYAGELCETCAPLFFQGQNDGEPISCSACHKACKGGCKGSGAKSCESCKEGWEFDEQLECIDVNECLSEQRKCKNTEFCQNMEGSYSCLACDFACNGCFGDGPDMCETCAEGYTRQGKICKGGQFDCRTSKPNEYHALLDLLRPGHCFPHRAPKKCSPG